MKGIALAVCCLMLLTGTTWKSGSESKNIKCLIQLTNYGGEGAYVVVSLLDAADNYKQTLYVGGFEEEWYPDLPEWYAFYDDDWESIDGITGASIQSGGRKITSLVINEDKLNIGYKLRFETSVEDEKYYSKDVEVELTSESINQTIEGTGYIRTVRMMSK
ncbi:MAG: DUF2271 domain-containing protein [Bacteroidota bacterium]